MLNERLKKILYLGLAALMFASTGTSLSQVNVNARHVRHHHVYRHRTRRSRCMPRRKQTEKYLLHKAEVQWNRYTTKDNITGGDEDFINTSGNSIPNSFEDCTTT